MDQARLFAIEAFLQREDDELLYAPDGAQPEGMGWAWWQQVDPQMVADIQAALVAQEIA